MLPDPRPYFAELKDPRRETRNKLHKLEDIVMIVFCAVLSGVEDWVGMEEFAEQKESWLRGFLELPNGIPSHDTLSDVFGRLQPAGVNAALLGWVQVALPGLSGEHITDLCHNQVINHCRVSIMATEVLETLLKKAETLTPDEQRHLAAFLLERANQGQDPVRRRWREIRGMAYPSLLGEDAQTYVTRTRQEADEYCDTPEQHSP